MIIETVLSMLTLVSHFKKVMHRQWAYFKSRLAYTMAMFNDGAVHFHLAPFSL